MPRGPIRRRKVDRDWAEFGRKLVEQVLEFPAVWRNSRSPEALEAIVETFEFLGVWINTARQRPPDHVLAVQADAILSCAERWRLVSRTPDRKGWEVFPVPRHVWCSRYLRRAIAGGFVAPRPERCSECNQKVDVVPYHRNSERPLDFRWLCRRCQRVVSTGRNPGVRHEKPVWVVAGVRLRSAWERDFALFLELRGLIWKYKPGMFRLPMKRAAYVPNFYVESPLGPCYVELYRFVNAAERKLAKLVVAYQEIPRCTGLPLVVLDERAVARMQWSLRKEVARLARPAAPGEPAAPPTAPARA